MRYENQANALIVMGGLLLAGWCFGRAQGLPHASSGQDNSRVFRGMTMPDRKENPFWKSCTSFQDIPQAADGSQSAVCTNLKGEKYDLVLRPVSKVCTPSAAKEKDSYQHFMCSELDELMIRAQAREGDTEHRRDLGVPAGEF